MAGFTVQPDRLYQAGPQYEYVRSQLASIYSTAVQGLTAAGNFCGTDQPGQACARNYVPNATDLLERIDTQHQGIRSIADTIPWWASSYPGADSAIAQAAPAG